MIALQTPRLRLRPFRAGDAAACVAIRYHAEVTPWVAPAPTEDPLAAERARIAEFEASLQRHGYCVLAVLEGDSDTPIGHCGLRWLEELGATDIIWTIAPAAQGRGYAREAAAAALQFGFEHCGLAAIGALIRPDNLRSQGVAAALGMERNGLIAWRPGAIRGWWTLSGEQYRARQAMFGA